MNLYAFLEMCEPSTKVTITNENGTGGASYLAWPEHGWTAKEALEELGCGGFHVVDFRVEDGGLFISADENPWDFGSYWEEGWDYRPCHGYEVEITGKACAVEANEENAILRVQEMIEGGDVEFKFKAKMNDEVMGGW